MAEKQRTAPPDTNPAQGAVLRQGRAADPLPGNLAAPTTGAPAPAQPRQPAGVPGVTAGAAPASSQPASAAVAATNQTGAADTSAQPVPEQASQAASPETGGDNDSEQEATSAEPEQVQAQVKQQELRLMLRQCDRVLLMDFDRLAMSDWPDNYTLAAARRGRDLWLFTALTAAVVFVSGLTGFVPAWVAGTGFGAFVVVLLLGIPAVRRIYTSRPSYLDLIVKRRRMMSDARSHAAHLEGNDGLIWQCARMARFNVALKHPRFQSLLRLSERRMLPRHLTRREHVRLYLIYLLEAEKAYGRVQAAFFEGNQQAIDRGWQDVAAEPEPRP